EMLAFQRLLDQGLPFAEQLLSEYGEYYPFAFAIDPDDLIVSVGVHTGDDHPASTTVIQDLKAALKQGALNGDYQTIALFYDVRVMDPNTQVKTDAVAVFVEHQIGTTAYDFYHPYQMTNSKKVNFFKSFGNLSAKEIFTHG
ncbi:MAG: hypothetical protein V4714_22440, partial [Bacteroidota bacterium]